MGTVSTTTTGAVILQCGHHLMLHLPPDSNKTKRYPLWCYKCDAYKGIAGMPEPEWVATCKGKVCGFSRACGQSQALAEELANKHGRRFPTHPVEVEWLSPRSSAYRPKRKP